METPTPPLWVNLHPGRLVEGEYISGWSEGYQDGWNELARQIAEYWPWHGDLDGKLILEAVESELGDYGSLMDNTSSLFMQLTGGKISKPHTLWTVIAAMVEEEYNEDINTAEEDAGELAEALRDWLEAKGDAKVAAMVILERALADHDARGMIVHRESSLPE